MPSPPHHQPLVPRLPRHARRQLHRGQHNASHSHPIRRPIDLYDEGVNERPYGHKENNILNQVSDK